MLFARLDHVECSLVVDAHVQVVRVKRSDRGGIVPDAVNALTRFVNGILVGNVASHVLDGWVPPEILVWRDNVE